MDLKKSNSLFRRTGIDPFKILTDLFLLIFAFSFTYFLKRGNISFDILYLKFFPVLIACWFISTLFSKKFKLFKDSGSLLISYFISSFYFAGLLFLLIYGLNLYELSRFVIIGTLVIYLFLEVLFISGILIPVFKSAKDIKKFSLILLILEFGYLTISFFLIHYYKIGSFIISNETYQYILIFIYSLWFFTALATHKFNVDFKTGFFRMIAPFIRSYFIILSVFSFIIFGFRIEGFSRMLVFGTIAVYATSEILYLGLIKLLRHIRTADVPGISLFNVPVIEDSKIIEGVLEREKGFFKKYSLKKKRFKSDLVREKLKNIYLKNHPEILDFVERSIELKSVDITKTEVIDSGNPYNIEVMPGNSIEFFLNFHELNGFRYLNRYLSGINSALESGGVFIGKFEPFERRYFHFKKLYPPFFARLFYFTDFFLRRVIPKLPLFRRLYIVVTKGRNRIFSMGQALGRLYFNGFEIINIEEYENYVWFAVRKQNKIVKQKEPVYGLLFKQRRVGKNGKMINIYKMRTMHPYAEYIHEYIYKRNKLNEKGKIKDDFRITSWGKFLRKFWLDEMPMIVNWLKGDLKIVGVRPISKTFFNTYPDDLKKLRIRYKPGLVPPYYADLPQNMDEVFESERKYLIKYEKKPLRTNWKYFWKVVINILFKGAKSG